MRLYLSYLIFSLLLCSHGAFAQLQGDVVDSSRRSVVDTSSKINLRGTASLSKPALKKIPSADSLTVLTKKRLADTKAALVKQLLADSLKGKLMATGKIKAAGAELQSQIKSAIPLADRSKITSDANQNLSRLKCTAKSLLPGDSLLGFSKKTKAFKDKGKALTDKAKASIKTITAKNAAALASRQGNAVKSALGERLGFLKKSTVKFDLTLEDAVRYNQAPAYGAVTGGEKYLNVINVRGQVALFGVPVSVDYSTQPIYANAAPSFNNGLFKFDLDPVGMQGMFGSEMERFTNLKKNALGGLNLDNYARRMLNEEISKRQAAVKGLVVNNMLASYLDQPGKLSQLLALSKEQIRTKVKEEIASKRALPGALIDGVAVKAAENINLSSRAAGQLDQIRNEKLQVSALAGDPRISAYLSDPQNLPEIRLMNGDQLSGKLAGIAATGPGGEPAPQKVSVNAFIGNGIDLDGMISQAELRARETRENTLTEFSKQAVLSARQNNLVNLGAMQSNWQGELNTRSAAILALEQAPAQTAALAKQIPLSKTERENLNAEIDSVAGSLSRFKETLAGSGVDVQKMLAIQQYLDRGEGNGTMTEYARGLAARNPINAIQPVFAKLSALKVGSFSNQPAGAVQNQDVFMKGAHVTLRNGRYPITLGYGTVSDLNASKDAQFSSSVYNQSRKVTYLGSEIKNTGTGSFKVSIIGSVNNGVYDRLYSLPAISNNNVALTLSKGIRMGALGNVDIDVSKSTTLYNSNYQIGADVLLAQKSGLKSDLSADLFQAMSFGVAHNLDIEKLDLTEKVYVSYSGMGYQNPATNGAGGGRTKFGGSFRKTFDHNRFMVNIRSDFNNQPISYTSDDRWKNRQFQFDGRFVVNKKLTLSGKYISNNTDKTIDNLTSQVYSFNKIQLDGNANFKIGKHYTVSRLSLGSQVLSNSYAGANSAQLLTLNYTQSMVLDKNVLSATLFYNKEMSAVKLIGDMLNSDVSCQYSLWKKVSLSSGITYLNNTGIARQAGIRQNVNWQAARNFDISTFVDLRKNMIKPLYPDFYAACRAELSLRYRISY